MPLALPATTQRKPYQRGLGAPQQPPILGQAKPAYQRGTQPGLGSPQAPTLQAPMTQNGAIAQQQNLQGLQTGQFGDVQSAQKATDRAGALRQYQALQASRANAVRGNLSAEQAQRGQDQAMASANAQNLTAQNSVNALQRQYGQDALNRADTYENQAYSRGTEERGYQDSRADLGYSRATDEARYGDSRADVKYGQEYQASRDAVGDARYGTEYADKRADLQYGRGIDESRYADARGDVQYQRRYQENRDAVGDQRYDQTYTDSRGDVQYARGRDVVADQRYDQTQQYQQSRDALGDARYDQSYADQRGDTTYNRTEAQRLEGKGDINALISSVQDPRAQNLLRNVQAQGGDVQAMYNTMLDQGTIKEEYRSASPGSAAAQAKIDELKSFYPNKTDAEIQQMALAEREQERAAIQKPLADATNKAAGEDVLNMLKRGETPSESQIQSAIQSGAIPTIPQAGLPVGIEAEKKFSQEYGGKMVNLGGTAYKVEEQAATLGNTQASVPIFVNSKTGERMMVDGGALKVIPKTSMFYKA